MPGVVVEAGEELVVDEPEDKLGTLLMLVCVGVADWP